MSNYTKVLLFAAVFAVFSGSANAGSGGAAVPFVGYSKAGPYFISTTVYVTNITDHAITVSVKFYAKDGTPVSSSQVTYDNFITSNTQLAAHTSGYVLLSPPAVDTPYNYGRAIIEWQDSGTNDCSHALTASVTHQEYSSYGGYTKAVYLVNGGSAF